MHSKWSDRAMTFSYKSANNKVSQKSKTNQGGGFLLGHVCAALCVPDRGSGNIRFYNVFHRFLGVLPRCSAGFLSEDVKLAAMAEGGKH